MKPVYQTKFGNNEGNCLAACIASLFEVSIDDVPDFTPIPNDPIHWYDHFEKYFKRKGISPIIYGKDAQGELYTPPCDIYYLAWGKSPRGIEHSVIYRNGKLVHDPHPEGGGISAIVEVVVFFISFEKVYS